MSTPEATASLLSCLVVNLFYGIAVPASSLLAIRLVSSKNTSIVRTSVVGELRGVNVHSGYSPLLAISYLDVGRFVVVGNQSKYSF